jgi:hypothetical protein
MSVGQVSHHWPCKGAEYSHLQRYKCAMKQVMIDGLALAAQPCPQLSARSLPHPDYHRSHHACTVTAPMLLAARHARSLLRRPCHVGPRPALLLEGTARPVGHILLPLLLRGWEWCCADEHGGHGYGQADLLNRLQRQVQGLGNLHLQHVLAGERLWAADGGGFNNRWKVCTQIVLCVPLTVAARAQGVRSAALALAVHPCFRET